MQNRLVPHLHVVVELGEMSHLQRTPEKQVVLAPHWASQSKVPVTGRKVPTTFFYENQRRLWMSKTKGCGSLRRYS